MAHSAVERARAPIYSSCSVASRHLASLLMPNTHTQIGWVFAFCVLNLTSLTLARAIIYNLYNLTPTERRSDGPILICCHLENYWIKNSFLSRISNRIEVRCACVLMFSISLLCTHAKCDAVACGRKFISIFFFLPKDWLNKMTTNVIWLFAKVRRAWNTVVSIESTKWIVYSDDVDSARAEYWNTYNWYMRSAHRETTTENEGK